MSSNLSAFDDARAYLALDRHAHLIAHDREARPLIAQRLADDRDAEDRLPVGFQERNRLEDNLLAIHQEARVSLGGLGRQAGAQMHLQLHVLRRRTAWVLHDDLV